MSKKQQPEVITDMPTVNEAPAPVTKQHAVIKPGHIGLILEGSKSIIQIHSSMRHIYEKDNRWQIIEAETKKK